MSPRLTVLTPDFPPALGGIQHLLGRVTEGLAEDWEVTVVAPAHPGAEAADRAAPAEVLRTRSAWGGAGSAAVLAEMALVGRRAGGDVVLAGHAATLPAAFASARRRPVALYLYGSEVWAPAAGRVLRRYGGRVALALSISRFTAGQAVARGVPESRLRLVPPGADEPDVPPDAAARVAALGLDEAPYFLTVARLVEPHKGHDVMLRAMPALLARRPGLRYVVAGDGPLRPHFERLARAAGVTEAVRFTGAVDEPTKGALLAHCRALAMVSRESPAAGQFEGWGIAYLEAALAGRPVIGGRSGGVPEVVADGETGLLVEPGSVAATVEAAVRLLEDDGLGDRLGARGREVAQRERGWPDAIARVRRALEELRP